MVGSRIGSGINQSSKIWFVYSTTNVAANHLIKQHFAYTDRVAQDFYHSINIKWLGFWSRLHGAYISCHIYYRTIWYNYQRLDTDMFLYLLSYFDLKLTLSAVTYRNCQPLFLLKVNVPSTQGHSFKNHLITKKC